MKESFTISEQFTAEPKEIYEAWLDGNLHERMTGGGATGINRVGEEFTAWDGYISGENIELVENKRIVQSWRTTEFDESDEDSILIIELEKIDSGTIIELTHRNIPLGQTQYKQGWIDHYFMPMKSFFND